MAPSDRKVEINLTKAKLSDLSATIEIDPDGLLASGSYKTVGQTGNILKTVTKIAGSLALLVSASEDGIGTPCSQKAAQSHRATYKVKINSALDGLTSEINDLSSEIEVQRALIKTNLKKLAKTGSKKKSVDTVFQISSAESLIDFLTIEKNAKEILLESFETSDPNLTTNSFNRKIDLSKLTKFEYRRKEQEGSKEFVLSKVINQSSKSTSLELTAVYSPDELSETFGESIVFLSSNGKYHDGVKIGIVIVEIEYVEPVKSKQKKSRKVAPESNFVKNSRKLLFPKRRPRLFKTFTVSLDEESLDPEFNLDTHEDILLQTWADDRSPFYLDTYSAYGPYNTVDISSHAFGENDIQFTTNKGVLTKVVFNSKSGVADATTALAELDSSYAAGLKEATGIVNAKKDLKVAQINQDAEVLNKEVELLTSKTNFDYATLSTSDALKLKTLAGELALLNAEKSKIEGSLDLEFAEEVKRLVLERSLVTARKNLSVDELALMNSEIALVVAQQTRIERLESELVKVKVKEELAKK